MKKYLFGILAVIITVGFSAFRTRKIHKPFVSGDIYYKPNTSHQRVEPGYTSGPDPREYCLTTTTFANAANWSTTATTYTTYSTGSDSYIGKFSISNLDNNSDLDDDDGISIQQALDAVLADRSIGGVFTYPPMPSYAYVLSVNFDTDPFNDVLVYNFERATTVH
jgi:hypothetical protein